jgi:hypothetical protein
MFRFVVILWCSQYIRLYVASMVRLVMSYKLGGIWRETAVAKYCLEWQRKITKSCQDVWYRTGNLSSVSLRAYLAVQPYSVPAGTINRQSERKVTYQKVAWNVNSSGPVSRSKRNAICLSSRSVAMSNLSAGHNILFQVQVGTQSLLVWGPFLLLTATFSPILENCCPSRH